MTTTTQQRPRERAAEMPTERLEAELVTLGYRMARNTADLLVLVGEFDHRGTWALFGSLSCAAWLADTFDLDIATARTQVRVARAMREHDVLGDAVTDGRVSYAKARVLVPHLTDDNAADLAELAEQHAAGSLGVAIAAWSARHEGEQERDERHQRERRLSWRTDGDGMVVFTMRLAPADAGKVMAAIDQVVMTTPSTSTCSGPQRGRPPARAEDAPAGASDGGSDGAPGSDGGSGSGAGSGSAPGSASNSSAGSPERDGPTDSAGERGHAPAGASADGGSASAENTLGRSRGAVAGRRTPRWEPPSLAQQRADALVRIATGRIGRANSEDAAATDRSGSGTGRPGKGSRSGEASATVDVVAEMVIHIRGDGNTLADGTPISDHAVTSMIPGSFISLLRKDMAGRPIDASPRRRTPTRRQRRVVDEAHPTCAHPGCNARMFLEYDHIQPYAEGGPTVVNNLRRLCGPHNRARVGEVVSEMKRDDRG